MKGVAVGALLVAGVGIELVSVLGVATMRGPFDRLHYVGLAGYGVLLIGCAILVSESFSLIGDKALLTGALVAALGPVLTHATARSLRTREQGDWREGIERHREDAE